MIYKAEIIVTLKPEVKDAKAQVLEQVIKRKDFAKSPKCSSGKFYTLQIEAQNELEANECFKKIADEILANPVIEQYEIKIKVAQEYDEKTQSRDCCLSGN